MAMKEATEAVIFVEKITEQLIKAKENDGAINLKDSPLALPLLKLAYDAVKDLNKAVSEIRSANGEELQQFYVRASLATLALMEFSLR